MLERSSRYVWMAAVLLLVPRSVPAQAQDDPELRFWKNLKAALMAADGINYFEIGLKGAVLPTLKGKVVKLEPEVRPTKVLLALPDGITADVTLRFDRALEGTVDPGTELSFEGVGQSFSTNPFMLVLEVDTENLHGWTGKAPERKKLTPAK